MIRPLAAAGLLGLCAALVAVPGPSFADGGSWGPDGSPYRAGSICRAAGLSTALVSWSTPTGGPAFGLEPVRSGPNGTDEPATSGITLPVQASASGLDATSIAQLAYLITAHGGDASDGVVSDVAADVLRLVGTDDSTIADCLSAGAGGASQPVATTLLSEATRLAGPYSIELTGPSTATPAGQPIPLTATVTSAAGHPVPGVVVHFATTGSGTRVSASSATTDGSGRVAITARTGPSDQLSLSGAAAVSATVEVSTGLDETSASGDVSLVQAAVPRSFSSTLALSVDSHPHPVLGLTSAHEVMLNGEALAQTLTVTGLNGHPAAATVTVRGPLALGTSGCAAYSSAQWTAAKIAEAPQLDLPRDGRYEVADATRLAPGCYRPTAQVRTTDSTDVSASVTGPLLAVVPASVSAAPLHGGLAAVGELSTVLRVTGQAGAHWQDVTGSLLGPRPPANGTCSSTGWGSARSVARLSSSDSADGAASSDSNATDDNTATDDNAATSARTTAVTTTVSSTAVSQAGCYAFRIVATVTFDGIGSTTVVVAPGTANTPVHVIAPTLSVEALTESGVTSGSRVSATVRVASSDGQAGSLRLELLRLPYTYRGCFGMDWQHATVVGSSADEPASTTTGDDTYEVRSAPVPGTACWTVVPVFTARLNPAVQVRAAVPDASMLAFTSTPRQEQDVFASDTSRVSGGSARELGAGIGIGVAIVLAMLASAVAARVGRKNDPIDPRDQLLG